jgi:hypothetical protein
MITIKFASENILHFKIEQMLQWLESHIPEGDWNFDPYYDVLTNFSAFLFKSDEDAVAFRLKFNI